MTSTSVMQVASPAGFQPMHHHSIAHKPSFVAYNNYRFLIMDAPTDTNLPAYIEECKKNNVQMIVRACDPTYNTAPLEAAGIKVLELPFTDGEPPPNHVVDKWLEVCKAIFTKNGNATLGVHCVAGLGRAPVLVVIALVELGMDPLEAVEFVRKKRRGAINAKQVKFLEKYKPRSDKNKCIIM